MWMATTRNQDKRFPGQDPSFHISLQKHSLRLEVELTPIETDRGDETAAPRLEPQIKHSRQWLQQKPPGSKTLSKQTSHQLCSDFEQKKMLLIVGLAD